MATDSTGYEQTLSYHAGPPITFLLNAFCCLLCISSASKPRQHFVSLDNNGECYFFLKIGATDSIQKGSILEIGIFLLNGNFQSFAFICPFTIFTL